VVETMKPVSRRTQIISQYQDPYTAAILEIGALDSPTYTRDAFNVKYADFAFSKELSSHSKNNPRYNLERIVEVDYAVVGNKYSEMINSKFDIIVANHVIEHVPDAIGWMHDLGKILSPGGIVFLSVPDKRFTFDIARRETSFLDLLRAHVTRQAKPDFFNLLDHFWNHKSVKVADVLAGRHHELLKRRRFSPVAAIDIALQMAKRDYADVHCHVFTESTFEEILILLREFGYFAYEQVASFPVKESSNEFNVVLGRYKESLYVDRIGKIEG